MGYFVTGNVVRTTVGLPIHVPIYFGSQILIFASANILSIYLCIMHMLLTFSTGPEDPNYIHLYEQKSIMHH